MLTNSLGELEALNAHIQTRTRPEASSSSVATIFSDDRFERVAPDVDFRFASPTEMRFAVPKTKGLAEVKPLNWDEEDRIRGCRR